ncbi:hypothetical protein GJAV_G00217310 [Gymnothorax javanicus]|nr:hypothetical protein GJAV_G00217310 [Gymnothorax javanicus]
MGPGLSGVERRSPPLYFSHHYNCCCLDPVKFVLRQHHSVVSGGSLPFKFKAVRKSFRAYFNYSRLLQAAAYLSKMLLILAFIVIFHITSATLLFIATIDNAWWISGDFYIDLWYSCNGTCYTVGNSESAGYLQAVQATMILATILCCAAFFVFVVQLFRLKQGERFIVTAIIQLLSALFVMIGASIYTAQHENFQREDLRKGYYGYSFVLAWISFTLTLISGLMYFILRKRK